MIWSQRRRRVATSFGSDLYKVCVSWCMPSCLRRSIPVGWCTEIVIIFTLLFISSHSLCVWRFLSSLVLLLFLVRTEIVTAGGNNVVMSRIPWITTQSRSKRERRQCPKTSISSPITAKPDHKREEIPDDERIEKVVNIRVWKGWEEKTPKAVNNLN